MHLGDDIYEYGANPAQYGNPNAARLGRVAVPALDTVSLADYRQRYAQYRSDVDLQQRRARMPWIMVWNDHEFADDAYTDGALNPLPAQGDWQARKLAAARTDQEWMPIRTPDAANLLKIYRRFDFGNRQSGVAAHARHPHRPA